MDISQQKATSNKNIHLNYY